MFHQKDIAQENVMGNEWQEGQGAARESNEGDEVWTKDLRTSVPSRFQTHLDTYRKRKLVYRVTKQAPTRLEYSCFEVQLELEPFS